MELFKNKNLFLGSAKLILAVGHRGKKA